MTEDLSVKTIQTSQQWKDVFGIQKEKSSLNSKPVKTFQKRKKKVFLKHTKDKIIHHH